MFPGEERLMAAPQTAATEDSGLRPLFEKPLPENPTLLEALSPCHRNVRPNKPIDPSSFTEIFGELHFQEKPEAETAAALSVHGRDMESESELHSGGVVESTDVVVVEEEEVEKRPLTTTFPPPIRSIGPRVCFRSFREDGRLVVMEVVTPGKERLMASREGGRLRLQFASASAAPAGVVGVDDEEMHEDEDSHE
ncbi:unnamed protein product [Urochloa humidicola]